MMNVRIPLLQQYGSNTKAFIFEPYTVYKKTIKTKIICTLSDNVDNLSLPTYITVHYNIIIVLSVICAIGAPRCRTRACFYKAVQHLAVFLDRQKRAHHEGDEAKQLQEHRHDGPRGDAEKVAHRNGGLVPVGVDRNFQQI